MVRTMMVSGFGVERAGHFDFAARILLRQVLAVEPIDLAFDLQDKSSAALLHSHHFLVRLRQGMHAKDHRRRPTRIPLFRPKPVVISYAPLVTGA